MANLLFVVSGLLVGIPKSFTPKWLVYNIVSLFFNWIGLFVLLLTLIKIANLQLLYQNELTPNIEDSLIALTKLDERSNERTNSNSLSSRNS